MAFYVYMMLLTWNKKKETIRKLKQQIKYRLL